MRQRVVGTKRKAVNVFGGQIDLQASIGRTATVDLVIDVREPWVAGSRVRCAANAATGGSRIRVVIIRLSLQLAGAKGCRRAVDGARNRRGRVSGNAGGRLVEVDNIDQVPGSRPNVAN